VSRLGASISLPPIMIDETTFSYVSRVLHLTSAASRAVVIRDLFGSSGVKVELPLHSGLGEFSRRLWGEKNPDVVTHHSLIAIFQAFTEPKKYKNALEKALGCEAGVHAPLGYFGKDVLFRTTPAFCPECAQQDLKKLNFAYFRRQHQIVAAEYCSAHEKKLITACDACGSSLSFFLPLGSRCHSCASDFLMKKTEIADAHRLSRIKLSQFISLILAAEIPQVSASHRIALIRKKSQGVVPSKSGCIGSNVARFLLKLYGEDFLKKLRLDPRSTPSLGWPALLLSGATMQAHPIANALLISAFWESTTDYLEEILGSGVCETDCIFHDKKLIGAFNIDTEMLRKVYHAALHNTKPPYHQNLKPWIRAYPGLQERIRSFATRNQ
jgi:hypothetical protein